MANTTSVVIEALRYTYGVNRVLYLFNQESVMFNILGRVKKPVGGRGQFIMPVVVKNPGGFTGIVEGGTLPTALDMDTAEATFALKEFAATYNISWKLIQDSRNDKFAFQQALTMLDEGLRRRVFRNLNADLVDDGRGRLAVWTAADNSSPFTSAFLPRLETGMVIDVMSNSDNDTKQADSVTVTGVDPVARTFTTSGNPSGTAAGSYAVIEDTCDDSINDSLHTFGILAVVSDSNPASVVGNFGNINRSTAGNEFWKSTVLSNSGTNRPFTEDLGLQAQDAVREKGSGQLSHFISNLPIVRRYHEILAAERFFSLSSPGAIGGGVGRKSMGADSKDGATPYEFSGIPWHVDPYFGNNVIVGIDDSHFFLGVGENDVPRPVSELFDVPTFKQTTTATFEVNWYYQMQLLSDNPAAGVQIQDIAEA